jgi:hypothetical protein
MYKSNRRLKAIESLYSSAVKYINQDDKRAISLFETLGRESLKELKFNIVSASILTQKSLHIERLNESLLFKIRQGDINEEELATYSQAAGFLSSQEGAKWKSTIIHLIPGLSAKGYRRRARMAAILFSENPKKEILVIRREPRMEAVIMYVRYLAKDIRYNNVVHIY